MYVYICWLYMYMYFVHLFRENPRNSIKSFVRRCTLLPGTILSYTNRKFIHQVLGQRMFYIFFILKWLSSFLAANIKLFIGILHTELKRTLFDMYTSPLYCHSPNTNTNNALKVKRNNKKKRNPVICFVILNYD